MPVAAAVSGESFGVGGEEILVCGGEIFFEGEKFVEDDWFFFARKKDGVEFAEGDFGALVRGDTGDDEVGAVGFVGGGFEAGGGVDGVPHRGVIEAVLGAEVADDGRAGVDADAEFEEWFAFGLPFGVKVFERLFHGNGANVGAGDVIFLGDWSVPESHDRVAFVFVEGAAGLHNEVFHDGEVFVDLGDPIFDGDFFAYGCGIFDVGEENGDDFVFAAEFDLFRIFGDLVGERFVDVLAEGAFHLAFAAVGDEIFVSDGGEISKDDRKEGINHVEDEAAIEEEAGACVI